MIRIKYTDKEFLNIIDSYKNNNKFQTTKLMEQHGTTRYDHSYRVSYYSYKIAKKLHLNYKSCAIGGLLHDFFITPIEDYKTKDRIKSYFTHPKKALSTAEEEFNLTQMEKDIIRSHMFPINLYFPKYMESWIVSFVDKYFSTIEFSYKFRKEINYAYKILLIFISTKFTK